jgi:hypothetical protein
VDTKTLVYFALGLVFLFCLPSAVAFILLWATPIRDHNGLIFNFVCLGVMLGLAALLILWHLRYRRKWQQIRAKDWQQLSGRFDEGEIVTMRKRRAGPISGYQVWLGYDYEVDGEQVGLYTLPFFGEFPNKDAAEQCRMKVADRAIIVRVSPRNPKRSCVLDQDVSPYLA